MLGIEWIAISTMKYHSFSSQHCIIHKYHLRERLLWAVLHSCHRCGGRDPHSRAGTPGSVCPVPRTVHTQEEEEVEEKEAEQSRCCSRVR